VRRPRALAKGVVQHTVRHDEWWVTTLV
jgi:hypothetical protein